MIHTKYSYLTDDELISAAENSDDEMIQELVNRMNQAPDDDCECGESGDCDTCGERLVCIACDH